ncbi:hypothetical protein CKO51_20855 [Rhodopirellula sp. SM50]|nr:hypothetical protein CKO51_20855 [Rhodopirellula sp. SM50]
MKRILRGAGIASDKWTLSRRRPAPFGAQEVPCQSGDDGDRSFILSEYCDAATYDSAKSARDRDRLREEIIRARG